MQFVRTAVWALARAAGVVAGLFFAMSILGYLGILADVGEQENAQIGQQALWIGIGAAGLSAVILVLGWLLRRYTSAK